MNKSFRTTSWLINEWSRVDSRFKLGHLESHGALNKTTSGQENFGSICMLAAPDHLDAVAICQMCAQLALLVHVLIRMSKIF